MNTVQSVAKNTSIVFIGKIAESLIGILVTILLIRYLGSAGYGKYSFIYAFLSFFQILAHLGVDIIIVREISKDNTKIDKFIANGISIKLAFSVVAILASWIIVQILGYPLEIKTFIYIASFSLLMSFSTVYRGIFQAKLKMGYPYSVSILISLFQAGSILLLVFSKASLLHIIILKLFIEFLRAFILQRISYQYIKPRLEIDLKVWGFLLKESWPIILTTAFVTIYYRIDQVMLFDMLGDKELGLYSSTVRIIESLDIIPTSFMLSCFPLLSKYFMDTTDKFEKLYKLSFKYLSTVLLPICVGITIFAEPIIRLLYGNEFLGAALVLRILVWSEISAFLGVVHNSILISTGLQRLDFILTSLSAIMNIILNIILIPVYGIVGAAIATVISYNFGFFVGYCIRKTRKYNIEVFKSLRKPFLASLSMGVVLLFLTDTFPWFLNIFIGVVVYLIVIFLIRGLDRNDINYFRQILGKPGNSGKLL